MTDAQRKLGWGLAALLVAGNMIGSGLYLLPASLAPIGSSTIIGWVVATFGALVLAGVFAGLGRFRPQADGITDFVEQGVGPMLGYQASLAYWVAGWVGNAAIAVAAVGYLAHFFPQLEGRWAGAWANVGLIWLMTLTYMAGARVVARLGGLFLIVGLVPIVLAVVAGLMAFDPGVFSASWAPDGRPLTESVPASLALIFWAYLGVETAMVVSSRLRDPERDLGRASLAGVGLSAVVYIAASVAVFGVIPAGELAQSSGPFADLAGRVLGASAAGFVAVCAVVKTLGTLGGWILLAGETARSSARRGFLPRVFGQGAVTPPANPLIHAALMSVIALGSAQPHLADQFGILIAVTTVLILIVYALCSLALWRFTTDWRWRLLTVVGLAFSLVATGYAGMEYLPWVGGFFLLTSLLWPIARRRIAQQGQQ
ncbi:MAG: amino acid permease [Caulobacterales bacterium]|nr:amino acid permease [Caulobacterales bacterium]